MKQSARGLGLRKLLWKLFFVFGACAIVACVLFVGVLFYFSKSLPSIDQIMSRRVAQSTKFFDRTGKVLLYETGKDSRRTVIPLDKIPQSLKDATIAIEDENFYEEPAFSWKGIARAFLVNLLHGKIMQGGSTITQQLARNAFLSLDQTFSRKIKEFLLAIQLNRRYSKDQILESYLNEVPYGPTIYGVEAASLAYFNKPTNDLTLPESAILAAIPKAPSFYYPRGNHTKELLDRQKTVLRKMNELKKISDEELGAALKTAVIFAPQAAESLRAPHFIIAVQDYLTQRYGEDVIHTGGLKITTTLDWDMQQAAEKAVAEGAKRNEELYRGKNAALVAQDAKTGQILALVGSRNYFDVKNEGNFNVATQGLRQPGSALKPFAYLTAFQKGYTPETVLFDLPTEFALHEDCPVIPNLNDTNKKCFHPENFDQQFRGPVNLRNALAQSINIPAVKTLYLANMRDVIQNLHAFGITTLNDYNRYGLSLVLGGGEIKLIDLVEAYSVLSQEGTRRSQSFILEIKDGAEKVIASYEDRSEVVSDPQYARLVNDILSDVRARTPLFQNSISLTTFPDHDVAFKTGTSNDYRDAWALGYTPSLVVGVWAGNNDNSPMQKRGSSILAAVPIWHDFMSKVIKDQPVETFSRPEKIAPEKPILAGNYIIDNQAHSILYYIDRSNPQSSAPQTLDPQFLNWETPIQIWAKNNPSHLATLQNAPSTDSQGAAFGGITSKPIIQIEEPAVGSFIQGELRVVANIKTTSPIIRITASFNGATIHETAQQETTLYSLAFSFEPQNPQPQNLIKITVVDKNNLSASTEVIVYKK